MRWERSYRADPRAVPLADRHYNRHAHGAPQFVPPGRCVVLLTSRADALWVTSWPEFSQHAWAGAWVNSLFRNERPRTYEDPDGYLSSELIAEAVAATRATFGEPPALGMVSFVDSSKVRHKRDPGRCYRRAGWRHVGFTKDLGLHVFQQLPEDMPPAVAPLEVQMRLAI